MLGFAAAADQLASLLPDYDVRRARRAQSADARGICWPVSARVGNVRNNDSSLIEPVAAA